MKWADELYLSPKYEKYRPMLVAMTRSLDFPALARVFILRKTEDGNPRIEIVSVSEIKSRPKEFRKDDCLAVGIAENRQAALEMTRRMTEDAVRMTNDPDAAAYLAVKYKSDHK